MRKTTQFGVLWFALVQACLFSQGNQDVAVISVDIAHPGAAISPSMFGIFFEDINFGADGGLYPELVKNRSFEFQDPMTGWHEVLGFGAKGLDSPKGELGVHNEDPLNQSNPHYLRVRVYEPGYAFYNTGFRGMGIENGAEYKFSAQVRSSGPRAIRATITDEGGRTLGGGTLAGFDQHWKRYETVIRMNATAQHARLIDGNNSVDFARLATDSI